MPSHLLTTELLILFKDFVDDLDAAFAESVDRLEHNEYPLEAEPTVNFYQENIQKDIRKILKFIQNKEREAPPTVKAIQRCKEFLEMFNDRYGGDAGPKPYGREESMNIKILMLRKKYREKNIYYHFKFFLSCTERCVKEIRKKSRASETATESSSLTDFSSTSLGLSDDETLEAASPVTE